MPQNPDWQRYLEAGMQFTELRRSQARAVAAELVGQGQLARATKSPGPSTRSWPMSRRRSEELQSLIRREVERQLACTRYRDQGRCRAPRAQDQGRQEGDGYEGKEVGARGEEEGRGDGQGGLTATARRRLDAELVRRGLAPSRARAVEAVTAGPACSSVAHPPRAPRARLRVTSRSRSPRCLLRTFRGGGFKLAGALDAFGIEVASRRCVDVGASTGGFTDCLLQRGATHVTAIDVGRGQLDWRLRTDDRVTVWERTNVRDLAPGALSRPRPYASPTSRSSR